MNAKNSPRLSTSISDTGTQLSIKNVKSPPCPPSKNSLGVVLHNNEGGTRLKKTTEIFY